MKLPINELEKYFETKANTLQIAQKLTKLGFEVEETEVYSEKYKNFVIGKILSIQKHPDANKLNICQVDIGNKINQIVCGASNVRANLKVVVSLEQAIIPSSKMIIKKAVIRGIESNGMICSEFELGLSLESEGILELEGDYKVGQSFAQEFFNNDTILTLNITPNRGDCNGILGLARELEAAGLGEVKNIANKTLKYNNNLQITNNIADAFAAIKIERVKNIKSPETLKASLHKFGINSHSLIVDISNLTMMTFGLPIHIYNYDSIDGKIIVDQLDSNEYDFVDLKENKHKIKSCIAVKDSTNILSIFGVIGGKSSSINMDVNNILIECAYITPIKFAQSVKDLSIKTEARYRFERGVDREKIDQALEFASNLIISYAGGIITETFKNTLTQFEPQTISYSLENYKKLIGHDLEKNIAENILTKLGFAIDANFLITVPVHRHDIAIEADITEEIARIIGYDQIESKYALPFETSSQNVKYDELIKVKKVICNQGLIEIISFAFIDKKDVSKFGLEINDNMEIVNPISANLNYMRPSLIINLLNILKQNVAKNKSKNMAIFEEGIIFNNNKEYNKIEGLLTGKAIINDHFKEERDYDIFDAQKIVCEALKLVYNLTNLSIKENKEDFAHPYKSFKIEYNNDIIAKYGEIHPKIVKNFGLPEKIIFFEIFSDKIVTIPKNKFIESNLHAIIKDMAFIVEDNCLANDIINTIYSVNCNIDNVSVYDIYSGNNIKKGYKSLMFRITIVPQQELNGEEINLLMTHIANKLKEDYNSELRGEL